MRFALPDLDDSDYEVDIGVDLLSSSSDESDHAPDLQRRRKSQLARNIADCFVSSDSEVDLDLDSEDEVGDLLDDVVAPPKNRWREPKKETGKSRQAVPSAPRLTRSSLSASSSGPSWRRWEPSVGELLREEASQYTEWIRSTEAEAWHEGHKVAGERRSRLKDIEQRARAELRASLAGKRDAEAEELQRMMEGLAVRHKKDEEDTARQFADREAKLWADIDAAIREAERRAVEEQKQRLAAARKEKEEEDARIAAEQQAALQRKAEAERQAKEKAEKEASDQAERARLEAEERQRNEEAKAKEEQRKAAAAEGSRGPTEWAKWVAVQQKVKVGVIEPSKAGNIKKGQRQALRLITRGLGQVVNTKESVVRVTNDIHGHLVSKLPSPPSASAPVSLETMPVEYGYIASHTCKALIKQAEAEVSAKADAAYPLARIVLGLLLRGHAAFGQLLFARMVKKCPWVIPHYPHRQEGQSREVYEKSTGRATDESVTEYTDRMAGIVTLYFAILQTPLGSIVETAGQRPTPQELLVLVDPALRLPSAWTWMASILRQPIVRMSPVPHLLLVLFDSAGAELLAKYGPKQLNKVIVAVDGGIEAGVVKSDVQASTEILKLKLADYKQNGRFEPPKARIWT